MKHAKKTNPVVIPFLLPWDWSADYQKQTAIKLSEKHKVFAYMQKDAIFFLKVFLLHNSYPNIPNIHFYRPLFFFPFRRFRFIEDINSILSYKLFEFITLRKKYILWVFDPVFIIFVTCARHSTTIYDCVDFQQKNNKKDDMLLRKQEQALINSAHHFFVNSQTLYNLHSRQRKAIIVPMGFDLNSFAHKHKNVITVKQTQKIVGYIGAVNYRLDYKLLQQITEDNPLFTFIFCGPIQYSEWDNQLLVQENIHKLFVKNNVHYLPQIPRSEIPSLLATFSAGIIPYRLDLKENIYSYPMKLLEYCYMGKPVVSTPIRELNRFPEYVRIAYSVGDWNNHIRSLLLSPWPHMHKQRLFAINNSWSMKIEAILRNIQE